MGLKLTKSMIKSELAEHRAKLASMQAKLNELPAKGKKPAETRKLRTKHQALCNRIRVQKQIISYCQGAWLELMKRDRGQVNAEANE